VTTTPSTTPSFPYQEDGYWELVAPNLAWVYIAYGHIAPGYSVSVEVPSIHWTDDNGVIWQPVGLAYATLPRFVTDSGSQFTLTDETHRFTVSSPAISSELVAYTGPFDCFDAEVYEGSYDTACDNFMAHWRNQYMDVDALYMNFGDYFWQSMEDLPDHRDRFFEQRCLGAIFPFGHFCHFYDQLRGNAYVSLANAVWRNGVEAMGNGGVCQEQCQNHHRSFDKLDMGESISIAISWESGNVVGAVPTPIPAVYVPLELYVLVENPHHQDSPPSSPTPDPCELGPGTPTPTITPVWGLTATPLATDDPCYEPPPTIELLPTFTPTSSPVPNEPTFWLDWVSQDDTYTSNGTGQNDWHYKSFTYDLPPGLAIYGHYLEYSFSGGISLVEVWNNAYIAGLYQSFPYYVSTGANHVSYANPNSGTYIYCDIADGYPGLFEAMLDLCPNMTANGYHYGNAIMTDNAGYWLGLRGLGASMTARHAVIVGYAPGIIPPTLTPSPSPTATLTPSPSPSGTRISTFTPSPTRTPKLENLDPDDPAYCMVWDYLHTPTPTLQGTATASPTPRYSATPSATPTSTATLTPHITMTQVSLWKTATALVGPNPGGTATANAVSVWGTGTADAYRLSLTGTSMAITLTQNPLATATQAAQQTQTQAPQATSQAQSTATAAAATSDWMNSTPGNQGTATAQAWGTLVSTLQNGAGSGGDTMSGDEGNIVEGGGSGFGFGFSTTTRLGSCMDLLPETNIMRLKTPRIRMCIRWVSFPSIKLFGVRVPIELVLLPAVMRIIAWIWKY
jgi:hypothetical protein